MNSRRSPGSASRTSDRTRPCEGVRSPSRALTASSPGRSSSPEFPAPPVVCELHYPDRSYRLGHRSALRDQHVDLPKLRDAPLRLVPLLSPTSILHLARKPTSGRAALQGQTPGRAASTARRSESGASRGSRSRSRSYLTPSSCSAVTPIRVMAKIAKAPRRRQTTGAAGAGRPPFPRHPKGARRRREAARGARCASAPPSAARPRSPSLSGAGGR